MLETWYELTNKTWGTVLAETVEQYPEVELMVCGDRRVTYGEFYPQTQSFARGLLALGVLQGENIALWMTNCVEWMVAQFAVYEIGAPLVPINTRLAPEEVAASLKQSRASTLILSSSFLGGAVDVLPWLERLIPEISRSEPDSLDAPDLPDLKRVICLGEDVPKGAYAFSEILELGRNWERDSVLRSAAAKVNPFDVVNVVYTSGTTGVPKGGLSMHRNNMAALYHWVERTGLRPADRVYLGVPFATNFGCAYVAQLSVLAGSTIIVHEAFEPESALRAIEAERITWFPGAPTMYIMMLGHPDLDRFDLGSLRTAIVGGAPCSPDTIRAMKERMGFRQVVHCYGLSECGGLSTSTLLDDPIEKVATTVGVPFPSSAVRIVDPDSLEQVSQGEQGEIWLNDVFPGSCVGKGYFEMPEKTAETITEEGWFRTGDLGAFDADGYLQITGRIKDMYLIGGFNVYPVEIENSLHNHPRIKMAQVFGVPDDRLGEVGCAYIELEAGEMVEEEEIIAFCKEHMANYKVPRYVKFARAADFPLTPSGKVKKFELRKSAIREFGLSE
jgi:fatty-acyl-CoA synthase